MSETLTIHQALAAVAADVGNVRKAERNSQQGFNFRGIDAVVNAVAPALRRHGVLGPLPELRELTREAAGTSRNGATITRVTVQVAYRMIGPAGDELTAVVPGEANDTADKATAKAMSVAMRTFLLQALCLPTDAEDPDLTHLEHDPDGEVRAQCEQLVHRFVRRFGGDPQQIVAEYQAAGGVADPHALTQWLTARIPTTNEQPTQAPDAHPEVVEAEIIEEDQQ
ncbi:ERF family protein [Actinomyces bowdenii]|uniref:ERF family protein n=1 Tax=Actinomyces bowdenii TaxID=131109 RepID=UPI00214AD022|nr:ERF family protein [Actinomyces bowdenii]MCR2051793.1 ERF family protein [Actinomyces bowdenii]